jgi:DNA-binding response OmpR family regulator
MNTQPQPHLLVVDDDSQIRELLQEYLAENGMGVSVALNGAQMSQILADEVIDLVELAGTWTEGLAVWGNPSEIADRLC